METTLPEAAPAVARSFAAAYCFALKRSRACWPEESAANWALTVMLAAKNAQGSRPNVAARALNRWLPIRRAPAVFPAYAAGCGMRTTLTMRCRRRCINPQARMIAGSHYTQSQIDCHLKMRGWGGG